MRSFKLSAQSEALILLALFIISVSVMISLDLFEMITSHLSVVDQYELDEIILSSALFSLFISIYAMRRWREYSRLLKQQLKSAAALQQSNKQLAAITKQLYTKQEITTQLSRLVNYLQACREKEEAFKFIQESAIRLFSEFSGAIFITEKSQDNMVRVVQWGNTTFPPSFAPDDCWSLRLGKPFTTNPQAIPLTCRNIPTDDKTVHSCHPLLAYGEILGLLHLAIPLSYWDDKEEKLRKETELTLSMFTEQVSLSLSNIDLHLKLRHMAVHDSLTGLYNRHYLEETIEREVHRAERHQKKLGVIMMDLDHFKNFNDTHGHIAGDAVLAEIGRFTSTIFRADDFCCRYGGEEFIIILADIEKEAFMEKCESLRCGIEELTVTAGDTLLNNITVTIGAAIFPDHGKQPQQLIDAADRALYKGKKLGRNRFYLAEE